VDVKEDTDEACRKEKTPKGVSFFLETSLGAWRISMQLSPIEKLVERYLLIYCIVHLYNILTEAG